MLLKASDKIAIDNDLQPSHFTNRRSSADELHRQRPRSSWIIHILQNQNKHISLLTWFSVFASFSPVAKSRSENLPPGYIFSCALQPTHRNCLRELQLLLQEKPDKLATSKSINRVHKIKFFIFAWKDSLSVC